jgi:hypothetical protein
MILAGGLLLTSVFCWSGCGQDGPRLAEAGGVVTYQGKPVDAATVLFVPATGLPATAKTDAEGRFDFTTQGRAGATIGSGEISITAIRQRELTAQEEELVYVGGPKADAFLESIRSSAIPEKYGHPRTSGLTATVSEDPEQNHFTFDLQ